MNGPSTAREALIAEAIGELGRLLDRAAALDAAIAESRERLAEAHAQLAEQLAQVAEVTEHTKVQAVKHILVRTDEAAQRAVFVQARAMHEAAQALFRSEIEPALKQLAAPLREAVQRLNRRSNWLVLVTTAVASSGLTWSLAYWLWNR